jgi:hypothetical protein
MRKESANHVDVNVETNARRQHHHVCENLNVARLFPRNQLNVLHNLLIVRSALDQNRLHVPFEPEAAVRREDFHHAAKVNVLLLRHGRKRLLRDGVLQVRLGAQIVDPHRPGRPRLVGIRTVRDPDAVDHGTRVSERDFDHATVLVVGAFRAIAATGKDQTRLIHVLPKLNVKENPLVHVVVMVRFHHRCRWYHPW